MKESSFYESTGRDRINSAGVDAAQRSYTYNYLDILPQSRDAQIVDLGCSEGIAIEWLLMHGYHNIVGVDSDRVAVELAKKKFQPKLNGGQIICMDVFSYLKGCENSSVDMVIMFNVIEHVPKGLILEIVAEIRRVLKSGGSLLAQTGNWENPFNIGLFTRDFTHQVMYTKNSLRQLMLMSGFSENDAILRAVRYKTTLHNLPFQLSSFVTGWLIKGVALCMRMRIRETSPLIYCVVKK